MGIAVISKMNSMRKLNRIKIFTAEQAKGNNKEV